MVIIVHPPSKVEQRMVIHFLFLENVQLIEIHKRIFTVYGEINAMSYCSVKHWVLMLKEGRSQVVDESCTGCPATSVSEETVSIVHLLFQEDRHYMLADIHHKIAAWYLYRCVHICMWTQTRQAEARHMRTYALIATRGKMLSFAEPVNDSLWSANSRQIAFVRPQTKQRQFSSPRLHIYIATHASPWPASCVFLF